jgi:hypothetical protein
MLAARSITAGVTARWLTNCARSPGASVASQACFNSASVAAAATHPVREHDRQIFSATKLHSSLSGMLVRH